LQDPDVLRAAGGHKWLLLWYFSLVHRARILGPSAGISWGIEANRNSSRDRTDQYSIQVNDQVSADTAMRLARYFGGDARSWLNLQTAHDLRVAEISNAKRVAREVSPATT
jgi:hypothetical protein